MSSKLLIKNLVVLFVAFIACVLLGCSNSNSGNGGTNYVLGTLPNGVIVWVSHSSFTTASNSATSGSLGLSGGSGGGELYF